MDNDEWKKKHGHRTESESDGQWYLRHRCPECACGELVAGTPVVSSPIKYSREYVMAGVEVLSSHAGSHGRKMRLHSRVEQGETSWPTLREKRCDVAQFRRLTFAAAEKAAGLCEAARRDAAQFMRDKIAREDIKNIRVLDGLVTGSVSRHTFDIVMWAIINDEWAAEIAEMTRVCKSGGWLIGVPVTRSTMSRAELTSRGWEEIHYIGSFGRTFTYIAQVYK